MSLKFFARMQRIESFIILPTYAKRKVCERIVPYFRGGVKKSSFPCLQGRRGGDGMSSTTHGSVTPRRTEREKRNDISHIQ